MTIAARKCPRKRGRPLALLVIATKSRRPNKKIPDQVGDDIMGRGDDIYEQRSVWPMRSIDVRLMPFRRQSLSMVVPYLMAIRPSVSPGRIL